MEATLLRTQPHFNVQGGNSSCNIQFNNTRLFGNRICAKPVSLQLSRKRFCSSREHVLLKENKGFLSLNCFQQNSAIVRAASADSINYEQFTDTSGSSERALNVNAFENSAALDLKPEPFRNRFLNF
ncbi:preprotein translocase subunit SCY2, chloroplastic isoform X2 [Salvia divinorum]|uniref:Preprotein translocase subunit SCY2, chloroplastic isoform X2 n=1 Tax=Salvia divinorum TaxID=28513 RepID=A0ABD1FQC3_SALDI